MMTWLPNLFYHSTLDSNDNLPEFYKLFDYDPFPKTTFFPETEKYFDALMHNFESKGFVERKDNKYALRLDVKNVDNKNIKINVNKDDRTVKVSYNIENNNYNYRSSYSTTVELPSDASIEEKDFSANVKDAILEITVEKKPLEKKEAVNEDIKIKFD